MEFDSYSEKDTEKIGEEFARNLKKGDVIALFADIGCGKTVITKGIAKVFGNRAYSPTFALMNEYEGSIPIYHFDAYRIDADGWLDSGFDEYLFGNGICIIEWAENIESILPDKYIKIEITKDLSKGEDYRKIKIEGER